MDGKKYLRKEKSPADLLRLILTPNCNLSCIYCHNEGFDRENSFSELSFSELEQILLELRERGLESVCVSGGEPLIHKRFDDILRITADVLKGEGISLHLSSNGILLDKHMSSINRANVERINISCDAIDAKTYKYITKKDYFFKVIDNINHIVDFGYYVNVNCVVLPGINSEDEYIRNIIEFWSTKKVRLSFLRLCFNRTKNRYDMNNLFKLLNNMNLKSYLLKNLNRPPTLCFRYHKMEIALRYYIPNKSNLLCSNCIKKNICSEGLYHPRLGLNGYLRACILRKDINVDMRLKNSFGEPLTNFLKLFNEIPGTWEPTTCDSP